MTRREIHSWLMDMDGVLVREESMIAGADRFIAALRRHELPFLLLTNNSIYTRRDLAARLRTSGLEVPEESIWTSALATAGFLADQRPGGSAFVIGESGLTTALHDEGYTLTERDPDYVVLGETRTYSFERITTAIRLILAGARFIATNPDPTGPSAQGPLPATGSVAALISRATGVEPYFIGKPNPLMMRSALNRIDAHSETTAMIGDRMDTDIVAGLEAGLETILVLTGVTARADAERFPFRASRTLESVADLADELGRPVRVAALYDIHGNLPALEAVLAEVEAAAPDLVVVGGDVVAGPLPSETLERLAALDGPVRWVMGNADRMAIEAFDRGGRPADPEDAIDRLDAWVARQLTQAQRDRLASFEPVVRAGGTLLCHGSPRSDEEIITAVSPDERLAPILEGVAEDTVVCGHTHHQFDRRVHGRRVLNAGSVGRPYEDEPAAYWLWLGPEPELRRTDYDLAAAIERLRASGLPDVDELVLRESLLEPIGAAAVARTFEARATP